jgi:hypothetical protein
MAQAPDPNLPVVPAEYEVLRETTSCVRAFVHRSGEPRVELGPSMGPFPYQIGSDDGAGGPGPGEGEMAYAILFDLLRDSLAADSHYQAFARQFLMSTRLAVGESVKFSARTIEEWILSRY